MPKPLVSVVPVMVLICMLLLVFRPSGCYARPDSSAGTELPVAIIVRSTPDAEYQSVLWIRSEKWKDSFKRAAVVRASDRAPRTDITLVIQQDGQEKTYLVDSHANLVDMQAGEMLILPREAKHELIHYTDGLRNVHYGKMLHWNEVKKVLPKKSVFTVIDPETGLEFQVQRRAGSHHADVQPLTKQDTATMKQIYGGKWSWKRKAVLVRKDGQYLAASMNGMPHGGDGIPGNGFRGHFCIHFLGSSTHRSGKVDLAHQFMVHQAAGQLDRLLRETSPYTVAEAFFLAVNQQDRELVRRLLSEEQFLRMEPFLNQIRSVQVLSRPEPEDWTHLLIIELPYTASVARTGSGAEEIRFTLHLRRASFMDPWLIEGIHMVLR